MMTTNPAHDNDASHVWRGTVSPTSRVGSTFHKLLFYIKTHSIAADTQ
jgi:hypothetical protein